MKPYGFSVLCLAGILLLVRGLEACLWVLVLGYSYHILRTLLK